MELPHAEQPHADTERVAARTRLRASLMMLGCVLVFCLMDALLKTLSAHYPPFQVAALRGGSSLPWVLAWAALTTGLRPLLRVRWSLHLLRGALGIMMMAAFVYALRTLPLSTAYTIFFVAPLLITALSVPFLGEHVGPRRWTAIAIGFIGVLVVLRPTSGNALSLAGFAVLAAALGYAVSAITVRILARTDSSQASRTTPITGHSIRGEGRRRRFTRQTPAKRESPRVASISCLTPRDDAARSAGCRRS